MTKKLLEKKDLYIEFTDEELASLGLEKNQRLSIQTKDDSIVIKPWVKVDFDISSCSREVLELLISRSLEKDMTVNDVIVDILNTQLNIKEEDQLICG